MQRGDKAAIQASIKRLANEMSCKRYEIRIKFEELKELQGELKQLKSSQKWRKEMLD